MILSDICVHEGGAFYLYYSYNINFTTPPSVAKREKVSCLNSGLEPQGWLLSSGEKITESSKEAITDGFETN